MTYRTGSVSITGSKLSLGWEMRKERERISCPACGRQGRTKLETEPAVHMEDPVQSAIHISESIYGIYTEAFVVCIPLTNTCQT